MNYNWNWGIFWEMSADGRDTWFMTLIMGLGWTMATAFCAGIIALLLGSIHRRHPHDAEQVGGSTR